MRRTRRIRCQRSFDDELKCRRFGQYASTAIEQVVHRRNAHLADREHFLDPLSVLLQAVPQTNVAKIESSQLTRLCVPRQQYRWGRNRDIERDGEEASIIRQWLSSIDTPAASACRRPLLRSPQHRREDVVDRVGANLSKKMLQINDADRANAQSDPPSRR